MDWPVILFTAFIIWMCLIFVTGIIALSYINSKVIGVVVVTILLCIGIAIVVVEKIQT